MFALYNPKIAEIFLLTNYQQTGKKKMRIKYISTDGFLDFRAWIIALGKEGYEVFLNFKSEKELLGYNLDANVAYRGDLVFLAHRVYRELEGNDNSSLSFGYDGDVEHLYANMQWENLDEKYPILYEKYQKKLMP